MTTPDPSQTALVNPEVEAEILNLRKRLAHLEARVTDAPKWKRRARFCAEIAATIVKAIEVGNYEHVAAGIVGVSDRTLRLWVEKGDALDKRRMDGEEITADEHALADFASDVHEARSKAEARFVQCIAEAAPTDWKAAMTFNSRRWPNRWADTSRVEHSFDQNAGPPKIEVRVLPRNGGMP